MMQWFCEPMLWWPRGARVKPRARKAAAAASRSRTAMTAWSMCGGKRPEEALRRLVADDAELRNLAPLRVEEDDARRSEEPEALEQRAVGCVGRRNIRLQEQHAIELGAHPRIGQGEFLHLLARHAPVGIEIEHHRTTG